MITTLRRNWAVAATVPFIWLDTRKQVFFIDDLNVKYRSKCGCESYVERQNTRL